MFDSVISIPTTSQGPDKVNGNGWTECNDLTLDPPSSARKGNYIRWPRRPNTALKKNVWPKSREMKYLSTDSGSDGGISFQSRSNGDPDYDIKKLLDWNGKWLPPPEQWSARKGYTSRHFGQEIEDWMNSQPNECREQMTLDSDAYRGRETNIDGKVAHVLVDGVCKELVPRYWMSVPVEGKSLRQFWTEMPDRSPEALSDVDITVDPPWWNLYEDPPSCFITGLIVPEAKIDLEDAINHVNTFGFASAEERIQEKIHRNLQKHRRMMAKRNRPLLEQQSLVPQIEDRRIRPTANVYFRPVQPADVRGITVSF